MKITSRASWGARPPREPSKRYLTSWAQRTEFVVHYTEGPKTQTPKQIQAFHMNERGWNDIGYNFLVDIQGRIYEGRGWLVVGAHAHAHNSSGIGVAFIGRNGDATAAAKASIRALYDDACSRAGRTLTKRGHGQLSDNSTDCPGAELLAWVKAGMPTSKPTPEQGKPPAYRRVLQIKDPLMHGPDVQAWQQRMQERGWTITVDGVYGPQSAGVCGDFQDDKGLKRTGKVDKRTYLAAWNTPIT